MISTLAICHVSAILSLFSIFGFASDDKNLSADNIVGNYEVERDGEMSKVSITSGPDGTYQAKVYWVKNDLDKDGRKRLDEKNPDKELRNIPCDQILIMWDLKYNPDKHRWEKGKIYDPTRGIKASATVSFQDDGTLLIRGSVMGISEKVIWKPLPKGQE